MSDPYASRSSARRHAGVRARARRRCCARATCSLLSGDLGAGKTQLTKGLAAGLGVAEPVTSPTFNILLVHQGRLPLYHFDLYRLERAEQLEDLDFCGTLEADGVSVVEWGDRFAEALPADGLVVSHAASTGDDERGLEVRAARPRGERLALAWADACRRRGVARRGRRRVVSALVLAFDTATERIAVGVGRMPTATRRRAARSRCRRRARARRTSRLLPTVERAAREHRRRRRRRRRGRRRARARARSPACASASPPQGLAHGLGRAAVRRRARSTRSRGAFARRTTGLVGVVGDAMRGEVYPALFRCGDGTRRAARAATAWPSPPRSPPSGRRARRAAAARGQRPASTRTSSRRRSASARRSPPTTSWWPTGAPGCSRRARRARCAASRGHGRPRRRCCPSTRGCPTPRRPSARALGAPAADCPAAAWPGGERRRDACASARLATPRTSPRVLAIERATFADPWTPGMFADELARDRRASWLVAEDGGRRRRLRRVWLLGDEAHIMNLAVDADRRGRGLGRALLRAARWSARSSWARSASRSRCGRRTRRRSRSTSRAGFDGGRRAAGLLRRHGRGRVIMWGRRSRRRLAARERARECARRAGARQPTATSSSPSRRRATRRPPR